MRSPPQPAQTLSHPRIGAGDNSHAGHVSSAAVQAKPRIVVTRRIPDEALARLGDASDMWLSPHDRPLTEEELHAAISGADAVVTMLHDRVDGPFLDAAGEQLRCVANVAVGYDNIDVAAARERDVIVTNTPGVLTDATADIAMALILMATRRLGEGERLVRTGEPWSWNMFFLLGTGLQGKTLGVIGLGAIGQATARRARAFGMEIVYHGRRRVSEEVEAQLGCSAPGARRAGGDRRRGQHPQPADGRDPSHARRAEAGADAARPRT